MAVDPFHGIGGGERQNPGEHFVQGDAKRIEIAAGIDRTIHAAGLFGRDIGQGAGNSLRRRGRLAFARQPRRDAKSGEPDIAAGIDEHVRRFDILVDQTAPMDLTDGRRKVDGEPQELDRFEPLVEKAIERLAAMVLQHEGGGSAIADQRQRPRRPAGIEISGERVFVLEPLDQRLSAGDERQHWNRIVELPSPVQRKLPVVPQCFQFVTGEVHLHGPYPGYPRMTPCHPTVKIVGNPTRQKSAGGEWASRTIDLRLLRLSSKSLRF